MFELYMQLIKAYNSALDYSTDKMVCRLLCRQMDALADIFRIDDAINDNQFNILMNEL